MLPNIASRHYCTFIQEGSSESHNVGFMSIAGKTKYGHDLPSFLHATCKKEPLHTTPLIGPMCGVCCC